MKSNISKKQFEIDKLKFLKRSAGVPIPDEIIKGQENSLEHEKKVQLEEAKHGKRKSWQDNISLHIAVGILIGVLSTLIAQVILKLF
ncbi:hypothetical protein JXB41_09025 [Candidatus Woesearchaeota archaeon]|nr:hypothetical protein [Candidatus Woesearchaeota archaeon]